MLRTKSTIIGAQFRPGDNAAPDPAAVEGDGDATQSSRGEQSSAIARPGKHITVSKRQTELSGLLRRGDLRLVYVLGVPRSNSTLVCRMLARDMDAAIYEPALPASARPEARHAELILRTFRRVKGKSTDPVTMTVKDIACFVSPRMEDLLLEHAHQVVFTIRDPLAQHRSFAERMRAEFRVWQRVKQVARRPFMSLFYFVHLLHIWPQMVWASRDAFPPVPGQIMRAMVAAMNQASWRALSRQFAKVGGGHASNRVDVLDAGVSRLVPERAEEILTEVSARAAAGSRTGVAPLEVAAHALMNANSHWAEEARRSDRVKPISAGEEALPCIPDAWTERVVAALYPDYGNLFFAPEHVMRADLDRMETRPGFAQLAHLATARDTCDALAALRSNTARP